MKAYLLYIFDFDNTLVDTYEGSVISYRHALASVGIDFQEENTELYMGEFLDKTYLRFFPNLNGYNIFESSFYEKSHLVMAENSKIFSDVISCLTYLKQRGKIVSLATNKDRKVTDILLKKFDISCFFDLVLTCDDVENKKPHPEVINKCKEYFSTEDAVYIGDSQNDILAAHNASIDSILIERSRRASANAAYSISSLSEIVCV